MHDRIPKRRNTMTEALTPFDFKDLIVLDVANNHQGSVEHGLEIINSCADIVTRHGERAALIEYKDSASQDPRRAEDTDRPGPHRECA